MNRSSAFTVLAVCSLFATACSSADDVDGSTASESAVVGSTSAYTSLEENECDVGGEGDDAGNVYKEVTCNGQGGYQWFASYTNNDLRDVFVTGERFLPLHLNARNLGTVLHFGPKAEWRGTGLAIGSVDPYALIFRAFVREPSGHETNHLVVARLDKEHGRACIVDTVSGAIADHNVKAREIADANRATACPPPPCGELPAGEVVETNESFPSCEGGSALIMQGDGNLVTYGPNGAPTWSSRTQGTDGANAVMQGDGNFVLYGRSGRPLWSTGTQGHPDARLVIDSGGSLIILGHDDAVLWTSHPSP